MRIFCCSAEMLTRDFLVSWTSDLFHELRGTRYVQMREIDGPEVTVAKHTSCLIRKADIVVINLSVPHPEIDIANVGVIAALAHHFGKPVYTFRSDQELARFESPWIEQFETARFQDMAELVEFLTFDETL